MRWVGEHIKPHPYVDGTYGPGIGINGKFLDYRDAGDGQNVILLHPFVVQSRGNILEVPAGFKTNFASIPWIFRRLIPCFGRHNPADVVHDYIYDHAERLGISKWEGDLIHLDINRRRRVPKLQAYLMWFGLTLGGWSTWRKCRRRERRRKY